MPYLVDDALARAMPGTDLSRVRTELRLLFPSLSTKTARVEPTLSCNHAESQGGEKNWFDVERDYLLARTYSTVGVWESWSSGCRLG